MKEEGARDEHLDDKTVHNRNQKTTDRQNGVDSHHLSISSVYSFVDAQSRTLSGILPVEGKQQQQQQQQQSPQQQPQHQVEPPLPPSNGTSSSTTNLAEEAIRQRRATTRLLSEIDDHDNVGSNEGLAPLTDQVSSWVKQAAGFIRQEVAPSRRLSSNSRSKSIQRTSSPANIVERHIHSNASSPPSTAILKVTDATDTICSFPNCIQSLNIAVSRFHCRKCNGWYCARHAGHPSLGMRLDPRTGEADSQQGIWSRVCQRCFAERFFTPPASPPERNFTEYFTKLRKNSLQELNDEFRTLEGRYRRLGEFPSPTMASISFKSWERQVTPWEADDRAMQCRLCREPFSTINRRHHCRLCGLIVCGEIECSKLIPLKFLLQRGSTEIRCCEECNQKLFRRQALLLQLRRGPADERADPLMGLYLRLTQVKQQVSDIIPQFNQQLVRLEGELERSMPDLDRVDEAMAEAKAARRTLLLLFDHYREAAGALANYTSHCEDEQRIVKNIQQEATFYLQNNMFTLQMLPRLDRERLQRQQEKQQKDLAINKVGQYRRAGSVASSTKETGEAPSIHSFMSASGAINRMSDFLFHSWSRSTSWVGEPGLGIPNIPPPANLAALRQKCDVLMEHRDQLEGFLTEAVRESRFEEVRSLRLALEQVNAELYHLQKTLTSYVSVPEEKFTD